MTKRVLSAIAILTIIAPAMHLASDVMEFSGGGYSTSQLLINYLAFAMMPFVIVGLSVVQWPRIGLSGLAAAVVYGMVFIYFAHTTLFALQESIPDYSLLWSRLGYPYTIHGILMIVSGLTFGSLSLRTSRLSKPGLWLFMVGLLLNLVAALIPISEVFQIVGSSVRNLGLIVIGIRMFSNMITGSTGNE